MRRKSPVTVQQWIDSLPISSKSQSSMDKNDCPTTSTPQTSPFRQGFRGMLFRDSSIQSDDASNCSSVESVLELRKPDPEAVLLGLGFGPPKATDYLSRIPKRFLQPSRLKGIDVGKFIEEQTEVRLLEENFMHQYLSCLQAQSSPNSPNHNVQETYEHNPNVHNLEKK